MRVKDKNKVDVQQTSGGIYEHNAICQNTLGSFVCTCKSYTNSIKYKLKGYWPIEIHSENYPLAPNKYPRHAQYYKMLLLLRSLNERALGARIKESQLFQSCHCKACLKGRSILSQPWATGARLKAERIRQKIPEKMAQEKFIVKWYMKCFIYWTADLKSSKLWSSQLWSL